MRRSLLRSWKGQLGNLAWLAVLWIVVSGCLPAQTVDTAGIGQAIELDKSSWRVEQGDHTEWKDSGFDDSGWRATVPTDRSAQRFRCSGLCWYRIHVSVPQAAHGLSLGFNNVDTSYQVFVNGQVIGEHGRMPPHASNYLPNMDVFPVPDAQVSTGNLVIAVRLWVSGAGYFGRFPTGMGPATRILLGKTADLELSRQQDLATNVYGLIPGLLSTMLSLLVGLSALLLYRTQRDHLEYLWLFGMGASNALYTACIAGLSFDKIAMPLGAGACVPILSFGAICNIEFTFAFLKQPTTRVFRIIEWLIVPLTVIWLFPSLAAFFFGSPAFSPILSRVVGTLWHFPIDFMLPFLLVVAYRRGQKEAGLLLIPATLTGLADYALVIWSLIYFLLPKTGLPSLPGLRVGPVEFNLAYLFLVLTWLTLGFILLERSNVIVRERERIAGEMQAAKVVQDVLMPKVQTPGYTIESVYRPAQEVGGDFYNIMPGPEESLRIVIGDVSGKGLKAAMMVALIVGALDQEQSCHPSEVLDGLNRLLVQHSAGGFTTCLCLTIGQDGTVTAANAGHFAPYQNGHEVLMDGELPLGLVKGTRYAETTWKVQRGDRLLLFSDGVPEARNAKGELFGFERTSDLLARAKTADDIVAQAQRFGQEDDITVLQVTMTFNRG